MRFTDTLIIHCTATRPDWMADNTSAQKVDEIKRWHVEDRGWSDIGYHYLIDRDGTVLEGRPLERAGAHCIGHNKHSIGIALIGGHGAGQNDSFADYFTPQQDKALRNLIGDMGFKYPITHIAGHNEFAAKACPGFQVSRWLKRKPATRINPAQSKTLQGTAVAAVSTTGSVLASLGRLDPITQYILLGFAGAALIALMIIARERLKRWARGDR